MIRTLLIFAIVFCLPIPTVADHAHENKIAYQAYQDGDHATAFRIWLNEAEQGDVVAQNMVGAMYMHGKGIEQDDRQAAKWHRRAAEQGNLNSQHSLALLYLQGHGVPQSQEKAYAWWAIATAKGNQFAREELHQLLGEMTREQIIAAQKQARELWERIGWSKVALTFPATTD